VQTLRCGLARDDAALREPSRFFHFARRPSTQFLVQNQAFEAPKSGLILGMAPQLRRRPTLRCGLTPGTMPFFVSSSGNGVPSSLCKSRIHLLRFTPFTPFQGISPFTPVQETQGSTPLTPVQGIQCSTPPTPVQGNTIYSNSENFRVVSMLQEHLRDGCPIVTLQNATKPNSHLRKSVNQFPSNSGGFRRTYIRDCSGNSVSSSIWNPRKNSASTVIEENPG